MNRSPKVVVFDLDGTVAVSKSPTDVEMGQLLAKLLARAKVAVMSGASFAQFEWQFCPAIPADANWQNLYLFPTNAASCYVNKDGKWEVYYTETFTNEEREKIMNTLKESMDETNFQQYVTQTWGEQIEDRGAQITLSALGQKAPVEVKYAWDPTKEKRRPLYDLLVKRLPDFSVGLNATTSIDITRKGINKAHGVLKLVEITGMPVSEMLYIGDALAPGGNDSVVIPTGIPTMPVFNPDETKQLIKNILEQK